MSENTFTLESLKAAIEKEYAPLVFTAGEQEFVLQNLLRMPKKVREEVAKELEKFEAPEGEEGVEMSDDELVDSVEKVLRLVTAKGKGERLVKLLDRDEILCVKLLERWVEATQPGEAQDSPA